jgi:hypothetical protein
MPTSVAVQTNGSRDRQSWARLPVPGLHVIVIIINYYSNTAAGWILQLAPVWPQLSLA